MEIENYKDFEFIRGQRIISQLLAEGYCQYGYILIERSTMAKLIQNIRSPANFDTRKRQFAVQPLRVSQLAYNPFLGTKNLLVRGVIKSDSGKTYDTQISFLRVNFKESDVDIEGQEEEESPENTVSFVANDGKTYHVERIALNKHDCQVRCGCLDFKWRFSWYNGKDKSLYGRMPAPYKRKTTTYPSANPEKKPGVCKHLLATVESLIQSGLVSRT